MKVISLVKKIKQRTLGIPVVIVSAGTANIIFSSTVNTLSTLSPEGGMLLNIQNSTVSSYYFENGTYYIEIKRV